jgi:hypothetical protein
MKKVIIGVALILLVVLVHPIMAATCDFEWKDDKVKNQTSTYTSDNIICMITIKASTSNYIFTEDGCKSGYCVEGIGTHTGVANKDTITGDSIQCHDISHVNYYTSENPTEVSICNFKAENLVTKILNFLGL